jgi:hypothetical protein
MNVEPSMLSSVEDAVAWYGTGVRAKCERHE